MHLLYAPLEQTSLQQLRTLVLLKLLLQLRQLVLAPQSLLLSLAKQLIRLAFQFKRCQPNVVFLKHWLILMSMIINLVRMIHSNFFFSEKITRYGVMKTLRNSSSKSEPHFLRNSSLAFGTKMSILNRLHYLRVHQMPQLQNVKKFASIPLTGRNFNFNFNYLIVKHSLHSICLVHISFS